MHFVPVYFKRKIKSLSRSMVKSLKLLMIIVSLISVSGCGYSFQTSNNPLLTKHGIRRIYVQSISNGTFKPGIENIVYSNLVRNITSHGRVILVHNPDHADAVLTGAVTGAGFSGSQQASVSSLNPVAVSGKLPTYLFPVNTIYSATLSCSFTLSQVKVKSGLPAYSWSSGFSRTKPFEFSSIAPAT